MDQDSFRQLISSGSSQTRSQPRESLFTKKNSSKTSTKSATINSSEPAFKPRKVKKLGGKYRDRAAERRVGEGNDYAQVEAVLEEFEKRTADQDEHTVDEQRRYLGGDSEHSILVKGLDMALLQQNKAKAAMATDEDESLEQAYTQSSETTVPNPKKRSREDILRELKEKRTQGGESTTAKETAGNQNKFKPIGFKPIGGSGEQKEKKKKAKGDAERKKKKRKIEASAKDIPKEAMAVGPTPSTSVAHNPPVKLSEPEETEPPEEVDIFADVGEYEGVGDNDDDDSEGGKDEENGGKEEDIPSSLHPGRWFATDEQMGGSTTTGVVDDSPLVPTSGPSNSHPPIEEGEASDEEQPMRLVPLSSSAVPSIKELLAIDEAAEAADKKHKRKNKKKGGDGTGSKKLDAEAKANRDYQRLKSYTDKRANE
ncbi:RED-like protein N-terminal region-domain-containing protein [Lentinula aff. detonsa]|uniref:RED-like protein N-terminal region-domain-containing protein n=1 Tax=Lentinula aff. detonsa TaxID=2804958 RepID=A0AA38NLL7_9AGAR|nr:RED-like protein N-terminal region-domain-containing protein [Lentinula aff. detonsa]